MESWALARLTGEAHVAPQGTFFSFAAGLLIG